MKSLLQTLFFFLLVTQIGFAQWYQQNSGTTQNLNAVTFTDVNNGFAVGDSGTILRTTNGGNNWLTQISGTIFNINDVVFIDENIGWAVGGTGWPTSESVLLRTTNGGIDWSQQSSGTLSPLNGVFFINANNGWIVGNETILYTSNGGASWIQQFSLAGYYGLFDVYFSDVNTGTAVGGWIGNGSNDLFMKTTDGGINWAQQPQSEIWACFFSVALTSAVKGFAVGGGAAEMNQWGEIVCTNDGFNTWVVDSTVTAMGRRFYDVYFTDFNNGTVVGCDYDYSLGVILRTTDAGENWLKQTTGLANNLSGVFFTDYLNGWIVGNNGTILHTTNGGVPVELTSFTATANGKEILLNWLTATELNNQGFEIQKSEDNISFNKIGFVPGFGTTTEPKSYSYTDQSFKSGTFYYRLKQVDYDGSYEYSDVVEIDFRAFSSYLLEQNYPNPFNPSTTIGFGIQNKTNVKITILNAIGEEVEVVLNEQKEAGYHQVEFHATNLPSGVYLYQLKAGEYVNTKKMILLK